MYMIVKDKTCVKIYVKIYENIYEKRIRIKLNMHAHEKNINIYFKRRCCRFLML